MDGSILDFGLCEQLYVPVRELLQDLSALSGQPVQLFGRTGGTVFERQFYQAGGAVPSGGAKNL